MYPSFVFKVRLFILSFSSQFLFSSCLICMSQVQDRETLQEVNKCLHNLQLFAVSLQLILFPLPSGGATGGGGFGGVNTPPPLFENIVI